MPREQQHGAVELRLWEEAWKHTPNMTEFTLEYRGKLTKTADGWEASRMEPAGDMEITGRGDTQEAAVQDWWENRLNAMAPEWLQGEKAALMLRSAGDPVFQNFHIRGYDDDA